MAGVMLEVFAIFKTPIASFNAAMAPFRSFGRRGLNSWPELDVATGRLRTVKAVVNDAGPEGDSRHLSLLTVFEAEALDHPNIRPSAVH